MSWVEAKLGEVCTIKRGTTITQKQAFEGDIPVVAGGLKPTYFHNVANRFGTTITVSGSGASAGYVNIWKQPIFASDCSTLEVNDSKLDILFVYYYLLSKQDYIYTNLRSGAAQPHVYGKDIAGISIVIPPLSIQKEIIEKLDTIFSQIEIAKLAVENNVKNAEALFYAYLNKTLDDKKPGWKSASLREVCTLVNRGISPSYIEDGGMVVLNQKCVRNHVVNFQLGRRHNDVKKSVKEERLIRHGDVLVNSTGTGTLGRVAQVVSEVVGSVTVDSHVTIVRPNLDYFYAEFFGYMMRWIQLRIATLNN